MPKLLTWIDEKATDYFSKEWTRGAYRKLASWNSPVTIDGKQDNTAFSVDYANGKSSQGYPSLASAIESAIESVSVSPSVSVGIVLFHPEHPEKDKSLVFVGVPLFVVADSVESLSKHSKRIVKDYPVDTPVILAGTCPHCLGASMIQEMGTDEEGNVYYGCVKCGEVYPEGWAIERCWPHLYQ